MEPCRYCQRERGYTCMNTRDMEDFAVDGDRECFFQLAKLGGGEKGLRYVTLNADAKAQKRASVAGAN